MSTQINHDPACTHSCDADAIRTAALDTMSASMRDAIIKVIAGTATEAEERAVEWYLHNDDTFVGRDGLTHRVADPTGPAVDAATELAALKANVRDLVAGYDQGYADGIAVARAEEPQ